MTNIQQDTSPITYRGAVYQRECDHMGHMNVKYYVGKFDEATWNLFALCSLTPSFFRNSGRGMAALKMNITYQNELHAGDVVFVQSRVLEVRNKSMRYLHELFNSETGGLAATNEVVAVQIDTDKRESCPFSDDIKSRLQAMLAG